MLELNEPWDPQVVTIKSKERIGDNDVYATYCEAVIHAFLAPLFAIFTTKYSNETEKLLTEKKTKRLLSIPHILAILMQSFILGLIYAVVAW